MSAPCTETLFANSMNTETRQKITREAIRHAQSKLHLQSPSPPHRSISNSSRGSGKLRWPSSPHPVSPSVEAPISNRPKSAPEPAAVTGTNGDQFPESADDVKSWIERQQQTSAVELQGSLEQERHEMPDGEAGKTGPKSEVEVPIVGGERREWYYYR